MKLTISPSEKHPSRELDVQEWLAKEKEFHNQFKSQVTILRETEKAYKIKLEKSQEEHWIPKSQCRIIKRLEAKLFLFE